MYLCSHRGRAAERAKLPGEAGAAGAGVNNHDLAFKPRVGVLSLLMPVLRRGGSRPVVRPELYRLFYLS
jgi:hypothetical protein